MSLGNADFTPKKPNLLIGLSNRWAVVPHQVPLGGQAIGPMTLGRSGRAREMHTRFGIQAKLWNRVYQCPKEGLKRG